MYKQRLAYLTLLSIQSHNRYSGVFVLKSTWSDGISPCYRSFWKFFLLKSWPFGSFLWDPDRKYSPTAFHLHWSTLCSPHLKFFSERSKLGTIGKSQKKEIVSFPFQLVSGEEVLLYNKLSRQQVVFQTFWNERKSDHKNVKRFIHDWQRPDHVYFREEQCIFIIIKSNHSHRNHCHNAQEGT